MTIKSDLEKFKEITSAWADESQYIKKAPKPRDQLFVNKFLKKKRKSKVLAVLLLLLAFYMLYKITVSTTYYLGVQL